MKTAMKKLAASLVLAGAAVTAPAMAATITWDGGEFELSLSNSSNGGKTWDVTYSADLTGYAPSTNSITHIAWKIAGAKIDSVDPGAAGGLANNEANCGAAGPEEQWVCYDINPDLPTTGDHSWTFNTTFASAITGLGDFSIKARFLDASGGFAGLMSCDIKDGVIGGSDGCGGSTEVPLPGTLGLLGLGLMGLGAVRRRKA